MQADHRQMSTENGHGDAIRASHLPGQGLEGMGDLVGTLLQALGRQKDKPVHDGAQERTFGGAADGPGQEVVIHREHVAPSTGIDADRLPAMARKPQKEG